jgi:hypothetical protein
MTPGDLEVQEVEDGAVVKAPDPDKSTTLDILKIVKHLGAEHLGSARVDRDIIDRAFAILSTGRKK